MIDWKSKEELQCGIKGCDKTIDISGLATTGIKEKLGEKGWSKSMPSPRCPEHKGCNGGNL